MFPCFSKDPNECPYLTETPINFGYPIPDRNKMDDDLLDAACLATIAKLGIKYGFTTIPKDPAFDSKGIRMQMVFCNIV